MANEIHISQYSPRQRELFIQKSTRVAASYLRRAESLETRRRPCGPILRCVGSNFCRSPGRTSTGGDENCSLMVIPVTCDCKKKLAGMLERLKPTVTLHVPSSKERDADMEEYVRELYRLIPILEEVTRQQVTPQSLAEAINQKGCAQYEMSRFLAYRQNNPPLLHGTQVIPAMAVTTAANWTERQASCQCCALG